MGIFDFLFGDSPKLSLSECEEIIIEGGNLTAELFDNIAEIYRKDILQKNLEGHWYSIAIAVFFGIKLIPYKNAKYGLDQTDNPTWNNFNSALKRHFPSIVWKQTLDFMERTDYLVKMGENVNYAVAFWLQTKAQPFNLDPIFEANDFYFLYVNKLLLKMGLKSRSSGKEPSFQQLIACGIAKMDEGLYDDAIAFFEVAIPLEPMSHTPFYYTGNCYQKKEDYKKAFQYYIFAIDLAPELSISSEIAFQCSNALFNDGQIFLAKIFMRASFDLPTERDRRCFEEYLSETKRLSSEKHQSFEDGLVLAVSMAIRDKTLLKTIDKIVGTKNSCL